MSLRDRIGKAWDPTREVVDVEGVSIEVRSLSVRDRARLLRSATTDGMIDVETWYPHVVVACCFDPESGEPAFSEADIEWLSSKSSGPVELLAHAGLRLSGMTKDATEDPKGDS